MAGYIRGNKYNLCSGYFPDYIPLDDNTFTKLYSGNDNPKYYPYTFNGGYLKQVYNPNSKYNYDYLLERRTAYAISKKFWGGSSLSSIGLVWTGRESGLNTYTHARTHAPTYAHVLKHGSAAPPCSERGTEDSETGAQGVRRKCYGGRGGARECIPVLILFENQTQSILLAMK